MRIFVLVLLVLALDVCAGQGGSGSSERRPLGSVPAKKASPQIGGVDFAAVPGTDSIRITYRLAGPDSSGYYVRAYLFPDSSQNCRIIDPMRCRGDIGPNVKSGRHKAIYWDYVQQLGNASQMQAQIKLVAVSQSRLPDYVPDTLILSVRDYGEIVIALYRDAAPFNVARVESLAQDDFYIGKRIHYIRPDWFIQMGDPLPGATTPVAAELSELGCSRGSVVMARKPDQTNPDRASSGNQMFIVTSDWFSYYMDSLGYTVVGQVVDGMDVVYSISRAKLAPNSSNPESSIVISGSEVRYPVAHPARVAAEPSPPLQWMRTLDLASVPTGLNSELRTLMAGTSEPVWSPELSYPLGPGWHDVDNLSNLGAGTPLANDSRLQAPSLALLDRPPGDRVSGEIDANPVAPSGRLVVPFGGSGLFLSAKLGTLGWLAGKLKDTLSRSFRDFLGAVTLGASPSSRISLLGSASGDAMAAGGAKKTVSYQWQRLLGGIYWHQDWTPSLHHRTCIDLGQHKFGLSYAGGSSLFGSMSDSVRDVVTEGGIATDLSWTISGEEGRSIQLRAGAQGSWSQFKYVAQSAAARRCSLEYTPLCGAAYLQAAFELGGRCLLSPGVRVDYYRNGAKMTSIQAGPAAAFTYRIGEQTSLAVSWIHHAQFAQALYPAFRPVSSMFFWIPTASAVQTTDRFGLGADGQLMPGLQYSVQGRFGLHAHVVELSDEPSPSLADSGRAAKSGGGDLSLSGLLGPVLCRIDYSFTQLFYNVTLGSSRMSYPDHSLGIGFEFPILGCSLCAQWHLDAGYTYAPVLAGGFGLSSADPVPSYHRLDIDLSRSFRIGSTALALRLGVLNAYRARNVMFYYREWNPPPKPWAYSFVTEPPYVQFTQYREPLLPYLGLRWDF